MALQRKRRPQEEMPPPAVAKPGPIFASTVSEVAESEAAFFDVVTEGSATPALRRKQASQGDFNFGGIPLFANQAETKPPIRRQDAFIKDVDQTNSVSDSSTTREPLLLQTKLTVGAPNDKYEQEADSVAAQVVKTINNPDANQPVQREATEEKEEDVQTKPLASIQRESETEVGNLAPPALEQDINRAKGSGQPLPPDLQQKMGGAIGADFSGVKIHTDSSADVLNRSLNARAFTTGPDLFFKKGEYNPSSQSGQELLAHELTHIVQQNGSALQKKNFGADQQGQQLALRQMKANSEPSSQNRGSRFNENHLPLQREDARLQPSFTKLQMQPINNNTQTQVIQRALNPTRTWLAHGQPYGSYGAMQADALQAKSELDKKIGVIVRKSRGHAKGLTTGLKTLESTERKAKTYGSEAAPAWHQVSDVARGTVVFDTLQALLNGVETLAPLLQSDEFTIDNRYFDELLTGQVEFLTPNLEYRHVKLNIRFANANNHVAELQLNTQAMMNVKEPSHSLYAISRAKDDVETFRYLTRDEFRKGTQYMREAVRILRTIDTQLSNDVETRILSVLTSNHSLPLDRDIKELAERAQIEIYLKAQRKLDEQERRGLNRGKIVVGGNLVPDTQSGLTQDERGAWITGQAT